MTRVMEKDVLLSKKCQICSNALTESFRLVEQKKAALHKNDLLF